MSRKTIRGLVVIMKELLKYDFKLCFGSRRFLISFSSIFVIAIYTFFSYVSALAGKSSLSFSQNYNMGLLFGKDTIHSFYQFVILFLPLISCLFYSDIVIQDKSNGSYNYYVTKCGVKKYLISKAFIICFVNFISVFSILFTTELLIWISIPNIGGLNEYSVPYYQVTEFQQHIFLSELYYYNPFIYIVFIFLMISLVSSFIGIIALSISLLMQRLTAVQLSITIFLCLTALEFLIPSKFRMILYFQVSPNKFSDFILTIGSMAVITLAFFVAAVKKASKI